MNDSCVVLVCCFYAYRKRRIASKYDYLHRVSDLLVYVQFPEDLSRVKQMLVLENPARVSMAIQNYVLVVVARTSCRSTPTRAGSESARSSIR
jgi:hypothetical protein